MIVGVSGAETGIRGFVDACNAATGERVWRFWTVLSPGEPGSETWGGESWKTGGDNEGNIFAGDSDSDQPLWNFQAGGRIQTNPMSFAQGGRQRIVSAAGRTIFVFGLPLAPGRPSAPRSRCFGLVSYPRWVYFDWSPPTRPVYKWKSVGPHPKKKE